MAETRIVQAENITKLMRLAMIVHNSINLDKGKENFDKAVYIRNHIYENVPLKNSSSNFYFIDIDQT